MLSGNRELFTIERQCHRPSHGTYTVVDREQLPIGSVEQMLSIPVIPAMSMWPFWKANPSGSATAANQPPFPPLATCTTSPGCLGPRDAIYNALDDLIRRLRSPTTITIPNFSGNLTFSGTLSDLAQAQVFSKLGKNLTGPAWTTPGLITYLTQLRPSLLDGTRSSMCWMSLIPWSTPCWILKLTTTTLVAGYIAADPDRGAVSALSSARLLTFFRPSFILFPNSGENIGNEATLFHEALHGYTGIPDMSLLDRFYKNSSPPSCNISTYIADNVLQYSAGLDSATNFCPKK